MTQGAADLDKIPLAEGRGDAEAASESAVATLAALFKQTLGDKVSEVRVSTRLTTSAVCLVAPDLGLDRRLEKILSRADQVKTQSAPVLELNPTHPLVKALAGEGDRRRGGRSARRRGGHPLRRGEDPRRRDAGRSRPTTRPHRPADREGARLTGRA